MPSDSHSPSERRVEQLASGELVLHRFGKPVTRKLRAAERERFEQAKRDGYLTGRNKVLNTIFFEWTEAVDRPYVKVHPRTKYATVSSDLIATTWQLTEQAIADAREILTEYSAPGAFMFWGKIDLQTSKVPNERADELARRLVDFLTDPSNRVGKRDAWQAQRRETEDG